MHPNIKKARRSAPGALTMASLVATLAGGTLIAHANPIIVLNTGTLKQWILPETFKINSRDRLQVDLLQQSSNGMQERYVFRVKCGEGLHTSFIKGNLLGDVASQGRWTYAGPGTSQRAITNWMCSQPR